ncbi:OmpH family outer membrane protein [Rhodopirellula sp. JC639]|uniref:OmpH family outer membrane protein n=1 Tax=Stieleria mannarensis TaxID=2755585 RepID=UPI00336A45F4
MTVSAQQAQVTGSPGHRVAVIDVGHVFKNLPAIQAQINKVKAELERHEAEIKQKREELNQAAMRLKSLKVGTPEYARQEEHVADLDSKLRLDMRRRHSDLGEAEAKIYYDNYQRIRAAVKAVAVHNHINLVLRFNSNAVDPQNGESAAREIMRNVVYQDDAINLTDTVMRYLEQQTDGKKVATGNRAAIGTSR